MSKTTKVTLSNVIDIIFSSCVYNIPESLDKFVCPIDFVTLIASIVNETDTIANRSINGKKALSKELLTYFKKKRDVEQNEDLKRGISNVLLSYQREGVMCVDVEKRLITIDTNKSKSFLGRRLPLNDEYIFDEGNIDFVSNLYEVTVKSFDDFMSVSSLQYKGCL